MEEQACPICISNITFIKGEATIAIKTKCDHYFHYNCWKTHWESGNDVMIKCPICRSRLNYDGSDLPDSHYINLLEKRMLFLLVSVGNDDE